MTNPKDPKAPSAFTTQANALAAAVLDLDDPGDWERATRGKIAEHPSGIIEGPIGGIAWNIADFDLNLDAANFDSSILFSRAIQRIERFLLIFHQFSLESLCER